MSLRARALAIGLAVVVGAGSLALGAAPALGNGGKGKRVVYRAALAAGEGGGDIQFEAELEPLLFRLTAVRNRYRTVRVRVRNTGSRPLVLSAAADAVEAHFQSGPPVRAVLDLGARDAAVWDGLPADVRTAVVYPRSVPPGEEENVFVFLPVADVREAPAALRYTLASRPDRPVMMRDVSAAVAH